MIARVAVIGVLTPAVAAAALAASAQRLQETSQVDVCPPTLVYLTPASAYLSSGVLPALRARAATRAVRAEVVRGAEPAAAGLTSAADACPSSSLAIVGGREDRGAVAGFLAGASTQNRARVLGTVVDTGDAERTTADLASLLGGVTFTIAPDRPRLAVAGQLLAHASAQRPYVFEDPEAPAKLERAFGNPRSCRRMATSAGGMPTFRATYRPPGGEVVKADLIGTNRYLGPREQLCQGNANAVVHRLVLSGTASVQTDLGVVRTAVSPAELPGGAARWRKAVGEEHFGARPSFPLQDACADEPGIPTAFDPDHEALTLGRAHGVVSSIALETPDPGRCASQPPRAEFERDVLANGCALFGRGQAGPPSTRGGARLCAGRQITVRVTRASAGDDDGRFATPARYAGMSSDGTVAWRVSRRQALVLGRGLRVETRAVGHTFRDLSEAATDQLGVASRIAAGLDYGAQPDARFVENTVELRAARAGYDDVVVGGPLTGADSELAVLYRAGRRVGYAVFIYDAAELTVSDSYRLSTVGSFGRLCRLIGFC